MAREMQADGPLNNLRAAVRRHGLGSLEQGGEVWDAVRRAGASSLYYFSKYIWSGIPPAQNLMRWRTHGSITLLVEDDSIKRLLVEFPRRNLKSSIATVSYPPHRLHQMVMNDEDPWWRFFFMAHNKSTAQRQWNDVRLGFSRPKFQFFCPELVPPKNNERSEDDERPYKWNEEHGEIRRSYRTTEPTFSAIASQVVGPHYNVGILDDLINAENYDSPTAVEKAVDMYRFSISLLDDLHSCRLIVVGNCWGLMDLNSVIHREAELTGFTILSVSSETGANVDGVRRCHNIPDEVKEVLDMLPTPIWPERFDEDALAILRRELGPRIYSAQMLNQPEDPDVTDFDISWTKESELVNSTAGPAIRFEDDDELMPLSECNVYVSWDPALEKKRHTRTREKSDNAIVVTFVDPFKRCGVLREHAKVESPFKTLNRFVAMCRLFKGYVKSAAVEEVLFSEVLKKLLRDRINELNTFVPLRRVKIPRSFGGKDPRIRAWLGVHLERGNFYIDKTCSKFREQVRNFGVEGAKRDLLDAAALGTKLWSKPSTRAEITAIERIERMRDNERGLTGYGVMTA